MRLFIVFALAIGVGSVFAFATYNYVQKAPSRGPAVPTQPVVVAAADLDVGAELSRDDLRVVQWPAGAAPNEAISNIDEIIGRGLIMPVVQNEPILPAKLAPKDAGAGLPPVIPAGMRAVSVRVNEVIGVAGYVLPGTHVDVVATVSPTTQQTDMTSKVILTDVQVLAAGTKIDRTIEKDKPVPVTVVTLLVDPEQAERLTLAASEGKIQLALRNPLDRATPTTPGVKPAVLMGGPVKPARPAVAKPKTEMAKVEVAPPPPPPPPPPPVTVEIIRGDKRAREVVHQEQQ
jgi:pilus assembly protein CpaB